MREGQEGRWRGEVLKGNIYYEVSLSERRSGREVERGGS